MGWRHNELDKWTYYDDNTNEQRLGWQQIDGEYYYLYSDDIAKGWFKDKSDSNWYYFAPSKQVIATTTERPKENPQRKRRNVNTKNRQRRPRLLKHSR